MVSRKRSFAIVCVSRHDSGRFGMARHNGGERKREEKAKEVRGEGDQEGWTNEDRKCQRFFISQTKEVTPRVNVRMWIDYFSRRKEVHTLHTPYTPDIWDKTC